VFLGVLKATVLSFAVLELFVSLIEETEEDEGDLCTRDTPGLVMSVVVAIV
jgi:hypothetical protein